MGRFSFWMGFTGMIAGAVFGGIDYEVIGGLVGALVGGFVCGLAGEALDLTIAPFFGDSYQHTFGKWFFRIIGLAILVVFCHEAFWAVHFASLAGTHNVAVQIANHIERKKSKESVQEMLQDRRWQVTIFSIRPTRWLLAGDVVAAARSTGELIDGVVDDQIPVDPSLQRHGTQIAGEAKDLLDKYWLRTWLFRFGDRDVIIPSQ